MDTLIDPPVSPYSPIEELRKWREKLETMPDSVAKDFSIEQVNDWIMMKGEAHGR